MADEIITPERAAELHQRALDRSDLAVWVISNDEPEYPGVLVARLVTDGVTPYVLTADTLPALRAKLPPGLVRTDHRPADPANVVEVWASEA